MSDISTGPGTGSGFGRLNWGDLVRGLVTAVIGGALGVIQQAVNADPAGWNWRVIGGAALVAGLAYLAKNLVTTQDGRVLGKIGAVALLVLAAGSASGCSSMFSGMAVGGAGGFDGPGAGAVKVTQTPNGCPDVGAQGSIPANAVDLGCERLADGTIRQHATIGALNPETILLESMKAQAAQAQATAALLQQLLPIVASAAATAAGGPAAGAIAGALTKPKPPTALTPPTPPAVPTS